MNYQTTILADAPVTYYEHEEASGTVLVDDSGNALNGTYAATGVTYEATGPLVSEASKAVTFDGVAGRFTSASLTGADRPTYPFTVEGWVKPASPTPTAGKMALLLTDDIQAETVQIVVGAGNRWRLTVANQFDTVTITVGAITGGWQYIVARMVSATERHLIVDNLLVGSETTTGVAWAGGAINYTLIGGWNGGLSFFAASFSRSAYYNADLSPTRVAAHYNAGGFAAMGLRNRLTRGIRHTSLVR